MPYPFDLDLEALFKERRPQMVNRGIPEADVESLRSRINQMWGGQPGCWAFESTSLARRYIESGQQAQGLAAFGYAKFPTLVKVTANVTRT